MKTYALFLSLLVLQTGRVVASPSGYEPNRSHVTRTPFPVSETIFIENRGQIPDAGHCSEDRVLYHTETKGTQIYFTPKGVSFVFTTSHPSDDVSEATGISSSRDGGRQSPRKRESVRMDMQIDGASPDVLVVAEDPSPAPFHFYRSHCPDGILSVPAYRMLIYRDVYPCIDLVFHAAGTGMKYEFRVRPGGDPSDIRLRFPGASTVQGNTDGGWTAATPLGELRDGRVRSMQFAGPDTLPVMSATSVLDGVVTFQTAEYDSSRTLLVDPVLEWSTYFGGSGDDWPSASGGSTIYVAPDGAVCLAGATESPDFPVTPGVVQTTYGGPCDVVVLKMSASGQRLWSTYYGAIDREAAGSICCDSRSNIIVGGGCWKFFPVSPGAFQPFVNNDSPIGPIGDGFLLKLTPEGKRSWATYIGGRDAELVSAIAIDRFDNIVTALCTRSMNMPLFGSPFQPDLSNPPHVPGVGPEDAFLVKWTPDGRPIWSTYYGGSDIEGVGSLTVDEDGNIVMCGSTASLDFPVSSGAFQSNSHGRGDAYLIAFDSAGNRLWATYLGGSGTDNLRAVTSSGNGNFVAVGWFNSPDFPVPVLEHLTECQSTNSSSVLFWFGSNGYPRKGVVIGCNTSPRGLACDSAGSIFVVGDFQNFAQFIETPTAVPPALGPGGTLVMKIDSAATLRWAFRYGGSTYDVFYSVGVHENSVYAAGRAFSTDVPLMNPFQPMHAGGTTDLLIAKFDVCEQSLGITPRGPLKLCPGDSVLADGGEGWQRYLWSTGDTTRFLTIRTAGRYRVYATDSAGCTGVGQLDVEMLPKLVAALRLPALEAAPGDRVRIEITLAAAGELYDKGVRNIDVPVRFHSGLLYPISLPFTDNGEQRTVLLHGVLTKESDVIGTIECLAMLGTVDETPLEIGLPSSSDACIESALTNGRFRLRTCNEGGQRLFDDSRIFLTDRTPNPSDLIKTIEFGVAEAGSARVFMTDLSGRTVATLSDCEMQPGTRTLRFDTSPYRNGMYLCVLQTATMSRSITMLVLR